MSGYLARLAARATGGPGTVQPRVPARFEPEPSPFGDPAAAVPELPDTAREGPRDSAAVEVAQSLTPRRALSDGRSRQPAATPRGRDDAEPPTVGTTRGPRSDPPDVVARHPSTGTAVPFPEGGRARSRDDGDRAEPAPDLRPVAPAPLRPAEPAPVAVVTARPVVRAVPPAALEPSQGTGPAVQGPVADPPETVVTISIGRVDVRAAAPAAPSTPPARPVRPGPEPLSLGDYLRGRREPR